MKLLASSPVAQTTRWIEMMALVVYFVVGGCFSMPCLCPGGEVAGAFKILFWLMIFFLLAWRVIKRTFRYKDYVIYFALVIGFCVYADWLVS